MQRMKEVTLMLPVVLSLASGASAAQATFSHSAHPAKVRKGGAAPSRVLAPATITESSDTVTITSGNSVSCNNGVGHTLNDYGRSFNLASFPALTLPAFSVQNVVVAVEQATGAGGTQPLILNLADGDGNLSGDVAPGGPLRSTDGVAVLDQSLSMLSINIGVPPSFIVATGNLVVDVQTPDGEVAGNLFFIGSNAAPETASSFLQAAACGVGAFTPTGAIGFPNMHVVMTVSGNTVPVELQTFQVE